MLVCRGVCLLWGSKKNKFTCHKCHSPRKHQKCHTCDGNHGHHIIVVLILLLLIIIPAIEVTPFRQRGFTKGAWDAVEEGSHKSHPSTYQKPKLHCLGFDLTEWIHFRVQRYVQLFCLVVSKYQLHGYVQSLILHPAVSVAFSPIFESWCLGIS